GGIGLAPVDGDGDLFVGHPLVVVARVGAGERLAGWCVVAGDSDAAGGRVAVGIGCLLRGHRRGATGTTTGVGRSARRRASGTRPGVSRGGAAARGRATGARGYRRAATTRRSGTAAGGAAGRGRTTRGCSAGGRGASRRRARGRGSGPT